MGDGGFIFSPWRPFGYRLSLWASFYITLLKYSKTKCNKKPLSELFMVESVGRKKNGLSKHFHIKPVLNTAFAVKGW